MDVSAFKSRYDDLGAGFTHWSSPGQGALTVVGCRIFSTNDEEPAWVAVAGDSRSDAARLLRSFGVHGLKFNLKSFPRFSKGLIEAALERPGEVMAELPGGGMLHLQIHQK